MKQSKYIGGSKIVAFRLPKEALNLAIIDIKAVLKKYEQVNLDKPQNNVKPLPTSAKTTLSSKPITDVTTYVCGCSIDSGLFKRVQGCVVPRPHHREVMNRNF
jgi:hypothetical protein